MKIGIFDSGIGGLTVFRQLMKKLPNNDYVYLGDTARLPYGIKSRKTVIEYSMKNTQFLINKGCDLIVIACNTASAFAYDILRKKFNVPIFNVIDSGVSAVKDSGIRNIGIIATPSTIDSKTYSNRLKKLKNIKKIISKQCPIFVPIVEEGLKSKGYIDQIISENLNIFKKNKIDGLILGCTHYPILKGKIKKFLGPNVKIFDSSIEIAKTIKIQLGLTKKNKNLKKEVYLTDGSKYFKNALRSMFNNVNFNVKIIDIR